jgi:hypothetical protein
MPADSPENSSSARIEVKTSTVTSRSRYSSMSRLTKTGESPASAAR